MEPNQFTTLGVVGMILTIITLGLKFFMSRDTDRKKELDAIDKEIQSANSADDIIRLLDKLRDN